MSNLSWLTPLSSGWLLVVRLLSALVLFFVGYLIAKGACWLVTWLLKLIRVDFVSKKIGLAAFLDKGDVKRTAAELVGETAYWIVIFTTVVIVAKAIGIPIKTTLVNLFAFASVIFIVSVILGTGLFLAALLSGIAKTLSMNFGLEGAKTFSRIIYLIVVIFAFIFALSYLGIKTSLIVAKLDVIIGAVGLAAAIAFGLGCKDMAADFLHNLFKGK